jgi:hypothetical protein
MAETKQLGYNEARYAIEQSVWMMRGDTRQIVFSHDLGSSATVKTAQLEAETNDDNATIVISLTKADHPSQWDFSTDNKGIILLEADDTATLALGAYRYAVQLTDQSDRVYTAQYGLISLENDVVNNDGTSPYPSWDTLEDLQNDIEQIATCGDLSWLTVAATGGATATLTVQNGDVFTAGDDIRVVLDDGTYEDDAIAGGGVSGNVLTLTGTIAGEAAIGNVVRIL